MMLSLPFSSWVGDSFGGFKMYLEFSLPILFVIGGLTMNWSEVRSVFACIGFAGVVVIGAASVFASDDNGRIDMDTASGSIGNSNDLASHLLLILPFVLYLAMDKRRVFALRLAMIAPIAYALKIILGTASRGALIALIVSFLFVLLRASGRQRVVAVAAGMVLVIALPLVLQGNAADRLATLFGGEHEEAQESGESRSYLLQQSLIYTLHHPLFGVGLNQFPNYEGALSVAAGKAGNWHETHNAFTQVSSECGTPALVFFVLGIGSALVSVNRTYRQARRQGNTEIANMCFCYLLAMVGFLVSITFLANAYRLYLPAMIGLAIVLSGSAAREMSGVAVSQPAMAPPPRPRRIPPLARPAES
jgi:O-antigen ligase